MKRRWDLVGCILVSVVVSVVALIFIYQPKFKDVTIEAGSKDLDLNLFIVNKFYLKRSKCLTDIEKIDLNKTGEYDIEFSFGEKSEIVHLNIIDTTAPKVKFKDITKTSDYKIDLNDFVESVEDVSKYEITTDTNIKELSYGEHKINVIVKDKYGNETSKACLLNISFIYEEVHHELGTPLLISEILVNPKKDTNLIDEKELKEIDVDKEGEYTLDIPYENKTYTSKVIIKDTLPPELNVRDITVYQGDKSVTNKSFVKSVNDNSKKVELTYLNDLDYERVGTQELKIVATDAYGNKTEKTAKLTIKKDDRGPVFKGLSDINIVRNASVDYKKGVSAIDAVDGECDFSIDTSKVKLDIAGTYYAKYISTDKAGNKTTKNRKIVVNPTQADIDAEFRKYYNKNLKGMSVLDMVNYIRKNTGYNSSWGKPDSVYYMLTNNTGNCYVHALFLKRALDEAGIKNMLIHTIDKTHYWNLVYQNGVWRHYDATPGRHTTGPDTDDEKFNSSRMEHRDWDRSLYPKAE